MRPVDTDLTILCVAGAVGGERSGWGYLLVEPDGLLEEDAGACVEGGVERMVLRAVVEGLSRHGSGQVAVRTRSRTLIRTAEDWIPGWRAEDWTRCDGVSDLRLIQELSHLLEAIEVHWVHLSYAQNPADQRARKRAQEATRGPVEVADPWADPEPFEEDVVAVQHPEEAEEAAATPEMESEAEEVAEALVEPEAEDAAPASAGSGAEPSMESALGGAALTDRGGHGCRASRCPAVPPCRAASGSRPFSTAWAGGRSPPAVDAAAPVSPSSLPWLPQAARCASGSLDQHR